MEFKKLALVVCIVCAAGFVLAANPHHVRGRHPVDPATAQRLSQMTKDNLVGTIHYDNGFTWIYGVPVVGNTFDNYMGQPLHSGTITQVTVALNGGPNTMSVGLGTTTIGGSPYILYPHATTFFGPPNVTNATAPVIGINGPWAIPGGFWLNLPASQMVGPYFMIGAFQGQIPGVGTMTTMGGAGTPSGLQPIGAAAQYNSQGYHIFYMSRTWSQPTGYNFVFAPWAPGTYTNVTIRATGNVLVPMELQEFSIE